MGAFFSFSRHVFEFLCRLANYFIPTRHVFPKICRVKKKVSSTRQLYFRNSCNQNDIKEKIAYNRSIKRNAISINFILEAFSKKGAYKDE